MVRPLGFHRVSRVRCPQALTDAGSPRVVAAAVARCGMDRRAGAWLQAWGRAGSSLAPASVSTSDAGPVVARVAALGVPAGVTRGGL